MRVFAVAGNDEVARVYIAEYQKGRAIEFVESIQPPLPREKKWVLMISTLYGCPVKCRMCDAGGDYQGKLTKEEMFAQIDYLVHKRYPSKNIPVEKFKIQFARMGEPTFNHAVLDLLTDLPTRYNAPGLIPSLSTIAPKGNSKFFDRLIDVKDNCYPGGKFQFQYSLHTTNERLRDELIPVKKWSFSQMSEYGQRFYKPGDRKITLNFALADGMPIEPEVLTRYFNPANYLIKITPLNPTFQANKHGLTSFINHEQPSKSDGLVEGLIACGYEVIVAIGALEENQIGSNCGQYILNYLEGQRSLIDSYTYDIQTVS